MNNNNKEQSYYEYAVSFVNNHQVFIIFSTLAILSIPSYILQKKQIFDLATLYRTE